MILLYYNQYYYSIYVYMYNEIIIEHYRIIDTFMYWKSSKEI